MSRVTSKLQITIPRAIARRYSIEPGCELSFEEAGEAMRLVPASKSAPMTADTSDREDRLRLFDEATHRQDERDACVLERLRGMGDVRGWAREDLWDRGVSR